MKIKFKAWDKVYGHFHEGDITREYILGDFLDDPDYIVIQYTGIHDKEGKEIYKDDILQEESTGKLFRCEWLDAIASFKLILMTDSSTMFGMSVASRSFTVVGNMYETGGKYV